MSIEVDKSISFIHALTKHLLHVPEYESQNVFIGVQPLDDMWRVRVSYSGFFMEAQASKLSDALGELVANLTAVVSVKLEEGAKLLGKT